MEKKILFIQIIDFSAIEFDINFTSLRFKYLIYIRMFCYWHKMVAVKRQAAHFVRCCVSMRIQRYLVFVYLHLDTLHFQTIWPPEF